MDDRSDLAAAFVGQTVLARAQQVPLAGDASQRRYFRLTDPETGDTAILMDAPPDSGEDIGPFLTIARHLLDLELSAPKIFAVDRENGFLLLEDLGDDLFARMIARQPDTERPLYQAATDLLVALHRTAPPDLTLFSADRMSQITDLAFTQYAARITGQNDPHALNRFVPRFHDILAQTTQAEPVLILRDYHAENLIWLPNRDGIARVGLLDFQDAVTGHPAYDLVSLLQDARRDVPATIEMAMLNRYVSQTGVNDHAFRTAYAVLGAQRNLRILGVFARLSAEMGRARYVDLIPRVWDHLTRSLDHPALSPVADLLLQALPAPTPENLDRLRPS